VSSWKASKKQATVVDSELLFMSPEGEPAGYSFFLFPKMTVSKMLGCVEMKTIPYGENDVTKRIGWEVKFLYHALVEAVDLSMI
jgi:hypothetical protein